MPDARNHYPRIKHHTPPSRWGDNRTGRVVSKPNSVSGDSAPALTLISPAPEHVCCAPGRRHYGARPLHGSTATLCHGLFVVLLRKEVIQPHLPVRLPCYDFVPIADPTFDRSLPKG